jgi:hypothetical protein
MARLERRIAAGVERAEGDRLAGVVVGEALRQESANPLLDPAARTSRLTVRRRPSRSAAIT